MATHSAPTETNPPKPRQFFTLEAPAVVRMQIEADSIEEGRDIMCAILNEGQLIKSNEVGIPFSVRITARPPIVPTGAE